MCFEKELCGILQNLRICNLQINQKNLRICDLLPGTTKKFADLRFQKKKKVGLSTSVKKKGPTKMYKKNEMQNMCILFSGSRQCK